MGKEKGERERKEKHMRWFLLPFIGVSDFIFSKRSISVMSKYPSKSVQVLSCRHAIFSVFAFSLRFHRFRVSILSPILKTRSAAQHLQFCLVLLFLSCMVSVYIVSQLSDSFLSDSEPRSGNGAAQTQPGIKASQSPGPQTMPHS